MEVVIEKRLQDNELYRDNFESAKKNNSKKLEKLNTPVEKIRQPVRNTVQTQSQDHVEMYKANAEVYTNTQRSFDRTDVQSVKDKSVHSTSDDSSVYNLAIRIREKIQKDNNINLVGKMNPKEFSKDGYKILKNQIPHLQNASTVDIVAVLRKSIIYNKNDIVAITKPYGLPSHGGPGIAHSVGDFVNDIIPNNTLYPVHRLDKETTGVMILAKSIGMAELLTEHFVYKHDVVKKYLVITKNIPEIEMGQIDIPILEGTVDGRARMALRPYNTPELHAVTEKRSPGQTAVTRYKVLSKGSHCALLECMPLTGKKHQVRVHLAFGLNCPILGDHKYAHLHKMAPMRLHPDILEMLKISQSGVRHLAMHLHARSIMIPNFSNGQAVFVSAPLPPHFVRNLNDLKLKLPPHT
ncbi:hypothetical protein DPMN_097308 [Dreissena polymorpha]|uniref:Pseudouridylate synthase RPUSD4, mitochondrial n=2 Tax=Dreissena polymorpha TaxID=45954 RepID=A0A9D4R4M4_DREPO|nr:hypothetical protein DPMN_097308 [Dreissena polymorpha]